MRAPGSSLLRLVSILFIIFGTITTFLSLIAIFASALLTSIIGEFSIVVAAAAGGILLTASVILLISCVLQLITGIRGVKKSGDPSQANFFIVNGFILCGLVLLSMLISFQVMALIGLILAILYIMGGYMNKNANPVC